MLRYEWAVRCPRHCWRLKKPRREGLGRQTCSRSEEASSTAEDAHAWVLLCPPLVQDTGVVGRVNATMSVRHGSSSKGAYCSSTADGRVWAERKDRPSPLRYPCDTAVVTLLGPIDRSSPAGRPSAASCSALARHHSPLEAGGKGTMERTSRESSSNMSTSTRVDLPGWRWTTATAH